MIFPIYRKCVLLTIFDFIAVLIILIYFITIKGIYFCISNYVSISVVCVSFGIVKSILLISIILCK